MSENGGKGTPAQQRAVDAYIKLWRAAQATECAAHRHLSEYRLTVSQFAVMEAIYTLGALSQRQLAEKILRSSGNLTMVIDNLERDGLVQRQRSEQDRRIIMVHLTPAGQDMMDAIFPHHIATIEDIFSVLTPAEQTELSRLTRKLGLAAKERSQEAPRGESMKAAAD